jgi:hypothetical protein
MMFRIRVLCPTIIFSGFLAWASTAAQAGDLTIDLGSAVEVDFVGAIMRWDDDGKPRLPVDPKAKIDRPRVDAKAVRAGNGHWVFRNLAPGRYDLVILAKERLRVEGFRYPPLAEFDPFLPADAKGPEDETRDWIVSHIAKSQHYENKVSPLFLAGDDKQVRILVQLVREKPTSFDADFGAPVATVRHEIWQYTSNYGGWVKDRRTELLDRILLARSEFQRWAWVWEPRLGGIEVGTKAVSLSYELPERFDRRSAKGWFPN